MSRIRWQIRIALWLGVVAGFTGALFGAVARWQTEVRNRSVEITLDMSEVERVAAAEGRPVADVLKRFHQAGAVSVAVPEVTIAALQEVNLIRLQQTPSGNAKLSGEDRTLGLEWLVRIEETLRAKSGGAIAVTRTGETLEIPADPASVRSAGVGLDPRLVRLVQSAHLRVVGRVSNYSGVCPAGIVWLLNGLRAQGVHTVIFSGDEVLGFKGYVADNPARPDDRSTAAALRDSGLNVGIVEFGKQKGDAELARAAADRVVRVHTVTGSEMVQATIASNVQRFLLGARERNIRLLYVRLFRDEPNPLDANALYIEKIRDGIRRAGLVPGIAHGYAPLGVPLWQKALIGMGVACAWLLLLDSVTCWLDPAHRPRRVVSVAVGLSVVALAGMPLVPGTVGVRLAALAAGCIYPSLAVLREHLLLPARGEAPVWAGLARFLRMCAITSLGIAAVIGLLADRLFLIKAEAFLGVKATLVVPVLIAALVYGMALHASSERSFSRALSDAALRLQDLAVRPVLVYQVAFALVTVAAVALLLMRSGNDPGVGVSPLELRLRALLDQLLYARPRFKEMFGHAAMVLGLVLAAQGRRQGVLPLILVGVVGQASLLNTFCHLHTPLLISTWRATLGILIGALAGVLLYSIGSRLFLRTAAPRA